MDGVSVEKGFTLIELLLVIVLIGIIGVVVTPMFSKPSLFQERFFIDEFSNMLRFARKTATITGCDVALKYSDNHSVGLFMRQNCTQDEFTRTVFSPYIVDSQSAYRLVIPPHLALTALPVYIDKNGKVYDKNLQWQKQIDIFINQHHQLYIDGFSGFMYEKIT